MLSKLPRALAIAFVFYVLPVLPKPAMLLDPRLLLVIAMVCALDVIQPSLSSNSEGSAADKSSMKLVLVTATLCHVMPILEWVYLNSSPNSMGLWQLGALMVVGGTLLRGWAIAVLGRYFSARVELQDEHHLVRKGPYRWLRHPSYSGAVLFLLGVPILLQTPWSLAACAVLLAIAYGYRIPVEERMLSQHFGDSFADYAKKTKRLIPYIW